MYQRLDGVLLLRLGNAGEDGKQHEKQGAQATGSEPGDEAPAGIADAGVCGIIGDTGILQIWAGVVPQPDFDFNAFMRSLQADEALRRKIEANIDRVLVVDRIPRTQIGKIQRGELREMLLKV